MNINNALNLHPEKIARYRIDGVIGSGAMGVVYDGYDTQIQRRVAIKILHHHLRTGELGIELEQRFLQEARAAARCLHPNIITIFDFGTEKDTPYIVMEYVDGIELKVYLQSDIFIPLHSAINVCIQVLEALDQAHKNGVIHRDIKPANIIILANGAVKVSDFGVARLDTSDLTTAGCLVGTPNYMSPEGLLGRTVDARSDLYSVGVVFYELLARRRLQRELSLDDTLRQLDGSAHLSDQNIRSVKPLLCQALQADPAARFQSASEFIAKLKSVEDIDLTRAATVFTPPGEHRPNPAEPAHSVDVSGTHSNQWNNDILVSLEHNLAKYIGPMAKFLVRKQSLSAVSMEELVARLTSHIPNEAERILFMKTTERTGILSSGLSAAAAPGATQATAAEAPEIKGKNILPSSITKKLTQLLAYHVGPIAGHIIKKTTNTTLEHNEMIKQMAQQIPAVKERQRFVDQALQIVREEEQL